MKTNLTSPCRECPFRTQSPPGWLGPWPNPETLHQFVMQSGKPLACHLTVTREPLTEEDYEPDELELGEELDPDLIRDLMRLDNAAIEAEVSVCCGSVLYQKKNGKRIEDAAIQQYRDRLCQSLLEGILNVREFHQHHRLPEPTV